MAEDSGYHSSYDNRVTNDADYGFIAEYVVSNDGYNTPQHSPQYSSQHTPQYPSQHAPEHNPQYPSQHTPQHTPQYPPEHTPQQHTVQHIPPHHHTPHHHNDYVPQYETEHSSSSECNIPDGGRPFYANRDNLPPEHGDGEVPDY